MPLSQYRYGKYTLDALARNHVSWFELNWVLQYAHPVMRRTIGALLHIFAADRRGELLVITCLETDEDEVFEIQTARYLAPEESALISTLLTRPEE